MGQIHGAIYSESPAGTWSLDRPLKQISQIKARFSMATFGIDRISLVEDFVNAGEARGAMENDLGKRLVLFNTGMRLSVSGFITNVQKIGRRSVRYQADGPLARMRLQPRNDVLTGFYTARGTLTGTMENYTDIVQSGNKLFVDSPGTTLTAYQLDYPVGNYPDEVVPEMLEYISGDQGVEWNYYLLDDKLDYDDILECPPYLQYLKARETSPTPKWKIWTDEFADAGLTTTLDDVVTVAEVYYNLITGTASETRSGGQRLTDSSKNFFSLGVKPGDTVVNTTDESRGTVVDVGLQADGSINSGTLSLSQMTGGTNGYFTSGDSYVIEMKIPVLSQTQSTTPEYTGWDRKIIQYARKRTSAEATDIASQALLAGANKKQSVTISTPYIQDNNEALRPLHDMFFTGPAWVIIPDFQEIIGTIDDIVDTNFNVFFIYSMDWDHDSNTLKAELGRLSDRWDVALAREKITARPGVYTLPRI